MSELEIKEKVVKDTKAAYYSACNLYEDTHTAYIIAMDALGEYLKEQDNG